VLHILKYAPIARIHCQASSLLPVKSSGRPAFKSTWAEVDMLLLLSVSDSDLRSEELEFEVEEGEAGCKGEGREVRESLCMTKRACSK